MKENCNCSHCSNELCIRKVPIFSSLNHDEVGKIAELIIHRDFLKGEMLLHDGEKSESIVIMHEGSAKAFKYTPDGREQILYVFSEGDFFGEQNLLSNRLATYSVEALTPVKTCILSKNQFYQLLYQHPDIAVKIIAELGERMIRLENAVQGMGVRNVDNRVGGLLLEFAAKYGSESKEGTVIQLPLSREGMANYLGVARETVSRKLSQLENEGIIRSMNNKSIVILDSEALTEIAGI
ncbi:Crp/Fnr family transcriptional regulator [Lachnospiraceae bacterium MD1]|uniref:Crp/Fnr family transcriptional regulator n=1 Tax=Variimorphobacter saccharofermentans TaxID=2755051 RepID=A0A839K399_9FIRM|nr:Crp/Fnr family transcriptional regulator [Variimorphobacter saccharofermentans]MBB2183161.1 Crp/Fnr family transcriptional regulator [Variimorphobacter saccharofermentans]